MVRAVFEQVRGNAAGGVANSPRQPPAKKLKTANVGEKEDSIGIDPIGNAVEGGMVSRYRKLLYQRTLPANLSPGIIRWT